MIEFLKTHLLMLILSASGVLVAGAVTFAIHHAVVGRYARRTPKRATSGRGATGRRRRGRRYRASH